LPLAFSPDGKLLAAGSDNRGGLSLGSSKTLRLWDVATGTQLHALDHPYGTLSVAFSPNGKTLAAGTWQATLHLWDVVTGKELRKLDKSKERWDGIEALSFPPDGKTLAVGSTNSLIYLLEVSTGKELHTLTGHADNGVSAVAFSPSGRFLASGGWDQTVRLWDVSAGRTAECHQFRGHGGFVAAVAFSPDGRRLASGSHDSTALVWDVTGRAGGQTRVARLAPQELTACWQSLRNPNAARAYQALRTLAAAPEQTVPFLAGQLQELIRTRPNSQQVARLLAELNSEEFRVRSKAAKELEKWAETIGPALRQALKDHPSLEVRRRLQQLLEEGVSPRLLQWLRAVEVLEWIDTSAARELLGKLAADSPLEEVGREAKAALKRLRTLSASDKFPADRVLPTRARD
jgi:WD40 repeat protein